MSTKAKRKYQMYAPREGKKGYHRKTDYKDGQQVVKPLLKSDYEKMILTCKQKMENYNPDSSSYFRWDRNMLILTLGVNCGLRINTLLESTVRDFSGGKVTATEQKTKKRVQFDLNKDVFAILNDYVSKYNLKPSNYLFPKKLHAPKTDTYTRQACWKMITNLAEDIGIDYPVGCHSLRKSYARWIFDDTHDLLLVQKLLMHDSPETTIRYIGLEESNIQDYRSGISFITKHQK